MRVEDDGGTGGLRVELPLLRDLRSLGAWRRTDGEGEDKTRGLHGIRLKESARQPDMETMELPDD